MTSLDVQPTPNPHAMKFTLDVPTTDGAPRTYRSAAEAGDQPLALALLSIPGVVYVFMTANFISVNKAPESRWEQILPAATRAVSEHFGVESA
jgi:hypothetical protein